MHGGARVCLSSLVIVLTLSGCAGMRPLPVKEPASVVGVKKEGGGLDPALSASEAFDNLEAYGNYYLIEASKLHANNYRASDASFAGALVGIAGGLTKSPQTAIAGALLGGGGSIASDRYKFQVQAQNYEKASDGMFCLRGVLYSMHIPGKLLVPVDQVLDLAFLNERISEIRRKLRVSQAAVQLTTPDLTKLQKALADLIESEKEKAAAIQNRRAYAGRNAVMDAALVAAGRDYYNAEFSKCVAAF